MQPVVLEGERSNPANPPPGCRFHTRCRYVQPGCRAEAPELRAVGDGRLVARHRAEAPTLVGALELDAGPPAQETDP